MSIDKEIEEFLQNERRVFRERREETPCQKESRKVKEKEKVNSTEIEWKLLKESGRREKKK
jgi:hypothetical protein